MKVQHDFDEAIMNENLPKILIPALLTYSDTMQSSRNTIPLLMDIQKLMLEEKSREEKRIHQLKQKQQHISQHVERCLAEKQRKLRDLQEKQKRKIYQQCTFKPKIQAKTEKRTLNQFLKQQSQFVERRNQKKNTMKANLESQNNKNTFHPKINNPKRKTTEPNKTKDTVFQRLYALKDKQNTENINLEQTQEQFQPKITEKSKKLNRNMPINDLLYNDALRRQQKSKDIEHFNCNPVQYKSQKLNLNNEKYVAQKFIKEYFGVIQKLEVPSSTQARIEYVMFNEILKQMGFVGVEQEGQNNKERSLIHQAYQLLEKYQVNAKNICVFLLAIIGVYHINPINFQEGDIIAPEKDFAIDQPDGRKLQKYFDLFKRNRLFGQSLRRQYEKQMSEPQQQHSYHPKINKLSSQLAEKFRDQMLQQANKLLESYPQIEFSIPEDGMINHTDLLVLNNLANQIKRQNKKQQLDRKQMDSCTFKPVTSPNSVTQTLFNSKMSNKQIASIGQKKSLELYNFHKNLQNKKESLRASRQSQDQYMKQCTFAPKINNKKVQNDMRNFQSKEIDQAIYRMKKGRDQTQEKRRFLQRGEKNAKYEKQASKFREKAGKSVDIEETPTLLLDVNLGQSVDRIVIYPGDQNRLQQLAKEFAHKHGLDSENEQKLYELLKIQLESVLMKIQEDQQIENQNQQ